MAKACDPNKITDCCNESSCASGATTSEQEEDVYFNFLATIIAGATGTVQEIKLVVRTCS